MVDKEGSYGGSQIVPAYVYAVRHSKKFIVAKQHPLTSGSNDSVETKRTNYFIINMTKENYFRQEGVYGPLSKIDFNNKCNELQTGVIKFDMTYPESP